MHTNAADLYDSIAATYDDAFEQDNFLTENADLFNMIREHVTPIVFDVGCGTGLPLRYLSLSPHEYFGIDPSSQMLNRFTAKWPEYNAEQCFFETHSSTASYGTTISLYGSPSYIEPDRYEDLKASSPTYFLMFYSEGYHSVTHAESHLIKTDYKKVYKVFPSTFIWHKYLIATNMPLEG